MIEVFILSLIQGITEFLPVSSSSHLILISKYLEFENQSLSIDVSLHIGSFLAVIIYFRNDIKKFLKNHTCKIIFEPGRSIIGNAGYLISKITWPLE